jgi:uncharacterized secreted repeat protein (TIGR03808 family)
MRLTRRRLLAGSAAGFAAAALPAAAAPLSRYGIDAGQFGVRPGAPDDQSAKLQRAINKAAATRTPLVLAPGVYRAGGLRLSPGAKLIGVRSATYLTFTGGNALISAEHSDGMTLSGLTLQGGNQKLPAGRGLIHFTDARALRITDCAVSHAEGNGITLEQCEGAVAGTTIADAADNGLLCNDSRGLTLSANTIRRCGNGGIRVWQSVKRHDGTIVADNTIEDILARAGGSGQNGNGVNVFRAGGVIVRNNVIRRTAFTAVRGNAANDIQILGNNCAALGEVALYSEFDFEGAVISGNIVDGAAFGVAVANFNDGGRLAVVQGNLIRNLKPRRPQGGPDAGGVGIGVEAETAVSANVIEIAPTMGISVGYGKYLRNVTVSGNVIRKTGIGVGVSVVAGAGQAAITGNTIEDARLGGVIGMEWDKPVTGDLAKEGAQRYPQLTVANNLVR